MDNIDLNVLATTLSDDARALIPWMSYDGEVVEAIANTARDARVPCDRARKAVRELRTAGLAEFGTLMSDSEPAVCGSGYWLSALGRSMRFHLSQAPR